MTEKSIDEFIGKFNFLAKSKGLVGIEREWFLLSSGNPAPRSPEFLELIKDPKWTYELSACQVEDRTEPKKTLKEIREELIRNEKKGRSIAKKLGLNLHAIEVAPKDMPLDVYPSPRYLKIVENISQERLLSACRVAAIQIHLGVPDIETAIQTANDLRKDIDYLSSIGDHSQGKRLELYKTMATNWEPPHYRDGEHFFEIAKKQNFVDNPRDCWHLIRISIHGTVELRMFGVTENVEEIIGWVSAIRSLLDDWKRGRMREGPFGGECW